MAEEEKEPEPDQKDPEQDVKWRWLQQPAVFCDTYSVDVWPRSGVVRLTFGEYTNPDFVPFFRAALVMPISDAKDLAKNITNLIRKAEQEEVKSDREAPSEQPKK